MENLLFVLALAGIILGGYSLFLPALRKRGYSLPLMHLVDDDDDEDDVGADDLDQPFDKALAAKAKAEKQPKPKKVKRGKGADSLIAEGFAVPKGLEMAPLPVKSARALIPGEEEEEIDPRIVIERPNAGLDPDAEIELDPELQALVDSVAEVEDGAAGVEATPAVAAVAVAEEPRAEEKPKAAGGDDFLSLFDDDTVEDTKPAALRDAIQLCTIEELQEEAAAMRALLSGQQAA